MSTTAKATTSKDSSPYARFSEDELTLRDLLAVDRTVVANERTFLGYLRTSLALLVAGVSMVKFFDSQAVHTTGWAIGLSAIPLTLYGAWWFVRRRRSLRALTR